MRRLLESPERRANLGRAARERAAGFNWESTAEAALRVLVQAAS
jgi:hypothetical protein